MENALRCHGLLHILPLALGVLFPIRSAAREFPFPSWKHHSIDSVLPGMEYGTAAFTLADFDGDGDPDITVSRREIEGGRVYWYENGGTAWTRHNLGIADEAQLGAAASDINGDGFTDLVVARYWFENPGVLRQFPDSAWTRHEYAGGLPAENHDMAFADFDNDGRPELLAYSQQAKKGTLRLYETAADAEWTYTDVCDSVNVSVSEHQGSNGIHGGFAPGGIGDLDSDGFPDVVMPSGWYGNPGPSGGSWNFHPWPFQAGRIPNLYGISMRSQVVDLDGDGDQDVVYTDCDNEGSEGYWIENVHAGSEFERHPLPSPGEPTGSLHSLAVADFDGDGDSDIFSGEQEDPDPGMKPAGLQERGFFWVNTGTPGHPAFTVHVIQSGNPGWHDVIAGDVDGDGDPDLVSKVWNKDGPAYHLDYWENGR